MEGEHLVEQREKKTLDYLKKHPLVISLILLAIIVIISVHIRLLPLNVNPATGHPGLWDVATNDYTLGPDLDPFLFLRWAKDIVQSGSLFKIDSLRYVPLGYDTSGELWLHPYMMAWLHNFLSGVGVSQSIEHSADLYPVFMFALTAIAFFFLAEQIFKNSIKNNWARNAAALIATLFLSIIPALLPRTIAGIPEKESAGFLFMFLGLLFFLMGQRTNKTSRAIIFGVLAGLSTGAMALIWGGVVYLFATVGLVMLLAFFMQKNTLKGMIAYSSWIVVSSLVMLVSTTRYSFGALVGSATTGLAFFALVLGWIGILYQSKLKHKVRLERLKMPANFSIFIICIVLALIVGSVLFGASFVPSKGGSVINTLVNPVIDRVSVTVAENQQPYFTEWSSSFGPNLASVPIIFWLVFIGSILFFWKATSSITRKERIIITIGYFIFLVGIVFSRYSSSSILNGTNAASFLLYGVGFIALVGTLLYFLFKLEKKGENERLAHIDIGAILLLVFFFLSIISARGAVRLIMILVIPASLIVGYFVVQLFVESSGKNRKAWLSVAIVVALLTAYSAFAFYQSSVYTAKNYIPSSYTNQWQYAMKWVDDNTPKNSVFAHWWDYGYWLQSIGHRATVLDGGNAIPYWNHLMGRYVLTGPDDSEGLVYLYTHNATHLLIDSSDIGKYGAFSSIGSGIEFDRLGYIPSFFKDNSQTVQTKNETAYLYTGGAYVDEDIKIGDTFLPAGRAAVGAILIRKTADGGIKQPEAIFVYQGQQYSIKLRYLYTNNELLDFGQGMNAGAFGVPTVVDSGSGANIDPEGSLLYLSNRTIKSQVARYYLFNQDSSNFKLVHSEDDVLVKQIKASGFDYDFVYYNGLRGPIKIWEINYPAGIQSNQTYLQTTYPDPRLIQR